MSSRNTISNVFVRPAPILSTKRFISERSFAAEQLKKAGEKLDPLPDEPYVYVTEDTVYKPTEKVRQIVDSVLELNVIEMHMFVNLIQV